MMILTAFCLSLVERTIIFNTAAEPYLRCKSFYVIVSFSPHLMCFMLVCGWIEWFQKHCLFKSFCHYTSLLCFICLLLIAGAEYYYLISLRMQNLRILAHTYSFPLFLCSCSFCFLKYGLFYRHLIAVQLFYCNYSSQPDHHTACTPSEPFNVQVEDHWIAFAIVSSWQYPLARGCSSYAVFKTWQNRR